MELAFARCKAWSKYVGHLLAFVRNRLQLEQDHAKNVQKLADHTKALLSSDGNNNSLPLLGIFNELMDSSANFAARTEATVTTLRHRFVQTLEDRQKDHDNRRRKLKNEWTKSRKQFDACAEDLRRARQSLAAKEDGYVKARETTLRHEQSVPGGMLTAEVTRKRKEIEKRRKNEEDALSR
ncbi:Protamine P1 family protein, partial [Aphelenchoides avenae]